MDLYTKEYGDQRLQELQQYFCINYANYGVMWPPLAILKFQWILSIDVNTEDNRCDVLMICNQWIAMNHLSSTIALLAESWNGFHTHLSWTQKSNQLEPRLLKVAVSWTHATWLPYSTSMPIEWVPPPSSFVSALWTWSIWPDTNANKNVHIWPRVHCQILYNYVILHPLYMAW